MKRLILPDIHGEYYFLEGVYNKENPDEVVLLGDYLDTHFDISDELMKESFYNILRLREEHFKTKNDKFTMLIGNHDYHYLTSDKDEQYSQFNYVTYKWAHDELVKLYNDKILTWCYIDEINKIIYSHAGISNTWMKETCKKPITRPEGITELEDINTKTEIEDFKFDYLIGPYSSTGDTIYNSPIWIRPFSLLRDMYIDKDGYVWKQVVGHTKFKIKPFWLEDKLLILDNLDKYYLIEEINSNGNINKQDIKLL